MGVQGLWQLLEPLGRPVSLESLENKVLAVDISIWIHQAVHGFRDKNGNPLSNSHLIGIFHRLCKLLSYRIKPVFVFDGAVPLLKRETMASRRERQKDAVRDAEKSRKQILSRHMKLRAIGEALNSTESAKSSTFSSVSKPDLYELPSMQTFCDPDFDSPLQLQVSSEDDEKETILESFFVKRSNVSNTYQDLDNIDVESDDFNQLPLEIQQEILVELKEKLKRKSWTRLSAMPEDPEEIGKHQIQQLLNRRRIQKKLDEVVKRMRTYLPDGNELASSGEQQIEVRRIVSEDSAHYVLFKKNDNVGLKEQFVEVTKCSTLIDKSSFEVVYDKSVQHEKVQRTDDEELSIDGHIGRVPIVSSEPASVEPKSFVSNESDNDMGSCDEILAEINVANSENKVIQNQTNVNENVDSTGSDMQIDFNGDTLRNEFRDETTKVVDEIISLAAESEGISELNKMERVETPRFYSSVAADSVVSTSTKFKTDVKQKFIDTDYQCTIENESFDQKTAVLETTVVPLSDVTVSAHDSNDDDFVEVDSPVCDELFPLEVFKVNTECNNEVVAPNLAETICSSENDREIYADEFSFVDIPPTLHTEELKLLSEQLEQEVETLVQDRGRQERIAATITGQMYGDIQQLLKLFGVPYVVSPAEAEAQCATLDVLELTEGTITDDSDIWLFGGHRVYKNVFNSEKDVFYFQDADIKQRLGLDRKKLIAVALLTGSDYTDGIKGIGAVSAVEVLAEFGGEGDGIEALHRFRAWWDRTQNGKTTSTETKIKKTLRNITLHGGFPSTVVVNAYMEPNVDSSKEVFSWAQPDLDELRHFARSKLGWSKEKLDGLLLPVIKRLNSKETQKPITDYFRTASGSATFRNVPRSRRLQRAIKRVRGNGDDAVVAPKAKALRVLRSKTDRSRGKCQTNPSRTPAKVTSSCDDTDVNLGLSESSSSGEEYHP